MLWYPEDYAALGYFVGKVVKDGIPLFRGIRLASLEELKSLSAALASSGGVAMFHIEGVTPEWGLCSDQMEGIPFTMDDLAETEAQLNDQGDPDFVSVGCPHCSLLELATVAKLLEGKKVGREFWICCSREVKRQSDKAGYSQTIEASGAKFAMDTCMVVAPIEEMGYRVVATNSAKACHYLRNNGLRVRFMSLEECVQEATRRR